MSFSEEGMANNTTQNHDISKPFCFETLVMQLQSRLNYHEYYYISRRLKLSLTSTPDRVIGDLSDFYLPEQRTFPYFPFVGDSIYTQENASGISYRTISDTVINGLPIADLIGFYYPSQINEIVKYKEATHAKHIGPVYFEEVNGSRWSLIKYNVVQ